MDALSTAHPASWWALVGVAMLVLELLLPGIYLMWLAAAALAVALALLIMPLPLIWQLALFALFAVITVPVGYRWYRRARSGHQGKLRAPDALMVGRMGVVVEPIGPALGKVKLGDSPWLAESEDALAVGTPVTVIGQRGTVVVVRASRAG